jgi:uncharacterized Zn finger protein
MAKRKAFGSTWWGGRWVSVLESFGWANRLQRGRTYARTGHVRDLSIAPGKVTAKVAGSRPQPYRVTITLEPLPAREWDAVIAQLAGQAGFAAKLLAGEMPSEIEEAFAGARVPLFPRSGREMQTACTCPDSVNPCKHVAATYYRLGEEFDADPFLLLQLRGRDRESLLSALRAHRAAGAGVDFTEGTAAPGADLPGDPDAFWSVGPAAGALRFQWDSPGDSGALLRRLGIPGGMDESVVERLAAYYRTIGSRARGLTRETRNERMDG